MPYPTLFLYKVLEVCSANGSFVYRGIYVCRFGTKTVRFAGHVSREAGREIGTVKGFTRDLQGIFSQRFCFVLCCARKRCRASVLSKRTCKEYRRGLRTNEKNGFSTFGTSLKQLSQKDHNELKGESFI
jgi:hypothetical protein